MRRGFVATAVALVVVLPLAPSFAATAPSPDATSGSGEPLPLPSPSGPASSAPDPTPSAGTAAPTAPALAPTMRPGVPATPSAEPSATTPPPAPAPGSDGLVPLGDYVDEYFVLTAQRDRASETLAAARTQLLRVDTAIARLSATAVRADLAAALARHRQHDTGSDVDDVVRELYQTGDSGLATVITALGSGPDGVLDRMAEAQRTLAAANGSVRDAETAAEAADLASQVRDDAVARVQAALVARGRAEASVRRARVALAAVEAGLLALGKVAPQVAVGPEGCPKHDVPATLRDGSDAIGAARLCRWAVRHAATPQAALALGWAFRHLGAEYACGGAGRMLPFRADCSSFVSRAYAEGAGLRTAGEGWAPSTRNMVPWDGVALDPHYAQVRPEDLRPGDLVLYDTCPQGGCPYKHVVMYLGSPDGSTAWMLHTNACGDVAKVEAFWGFHGGGSRTFLVARRVVALPGETVAAAPKAVPARGSKPAPARLGRASGSSGS